MFIENKICLYCRQSHKHPKRGKESSLRPHGTSNGKPGTVVDFSASQDHMVSQFCICLWTSFPLSKAINVFLPVTLACMCQLLIYDLMSLLFTPFDCSACLFFGFFRLPSDWLGMAPMCSRSNQLWPKRIRTHLL